MVFGPTAENKVMIRKTEITNQMNEQIVNKRKQNDDKETHKTRSRSASSFSLSSFPITA